MPRSVTTTFVGRSAPWTITVRVGHLERVEDLLGELQRERRGHRAAADDLVERRPTRPSPDDDRRSSLVGAVLHHLGHASVGEPVRGPARAQPFGARARVIREGFAEHAHHGFQSARPLAGEPALADGTDARSCRSTFQPHIVVPMRPSRLGASDRHGGLRFAAAKAAPAPSTPDPW